jgi:putative acetyltransferase
VLVRAEAPLDHPQVARVVTSAFASHGERVAALVEELRSLLTEASGCSLVAVEHDQVVGHVMLTPSLLDAPRQLVSVPVLSPLAVAPRFQRQGVGAMLVREGLRAVELQGAPVVFLEGSPTYYHRFGFTPGSELGFRKPSLRIPDAAFQALRLGAFEPWMAGTLVYSEVFWRHDAVGLREPETAPRP